MNKNGFKLRMSSNWLMGKGFHKRQVMSLSFMTLGFVQ